MTTVASKNPIIALLEQDSNICFADEVDWDTYMPFTEEKEKKSQNTPTEQWANVMRQLRQTPKGMYVVQTQHEEMWCDRDTWVWSQPEFLALVAIDFGSKPYAVHAAEEEWTERYFEHIAKLEQRWRTNGAEMCRFFQLPGGCRDGDKCKYSHEIPDSSTIVSDIHRDENGEPEVCRYFNLPCGCTSEADGKGPCPYKHIKGDIEPCRFFNTPQGCRKGAECIFPHVKIQEKDWRNSTVSNKPISLAAPATNPWKGGAKSTFAKPNLENVDEWHVVEKRPQSTHAKKTGKHVSFGGGGTRNGFKERK